MHITKKPNKKNQNNSNTEYKNIEDLNNKIKDFDYKINVINLNIKNIIKEKERILNENKNNSSLKEIKYEFSNINKKLDEIIL